MGWWLTLLGLALAHPLGADSWSLRTGVHLRGSGALALVVGEVPVAVVASDLRARAATGPVTPETVAAYTRERQQQLIDGLTVTVGGQPIPTSWAPAPSSANGRAVDGFFVYAVVATVPLPAGPAIEIGVDNQAWSSEELVFAAEVRADDPFGVVRHDAPSGWTRNASARRLTVRAQRAGTGDESTDGAAPAEPER